MNPQAFRNKLESAVEERNQLALAELEKVAGESPVTERIWNDHLLVERAIERWKKMEPALVSPVSDKVSCQAVPVAEPVRVHSPWFARGTLAALLLLVSGTVWSLSENGILNTFSLAKSTISPAPASGAAEERLIQLVGSVESPASLILPYSSRVNPALIPGYSLALTDQGRLLLPARILPVLPEVAIDWEQQMLSTLDVLASIPLEVQQAWERFSLPDLQADPTQHRPSSGSETFFPAEFSRPDSQELLSLSEILA